MNLYNGIGAALFADLTAAKASAVIARLGKYASKNPVTFEQEVVAEAFDSYYCTADLRSKFFITNPKTAAAFGGIRADLESPLSP